MDDLLSEFITETSESINEVDMQLVEFEKDPQNEAILGNIFRLVHTVKGTCGFLGLPRLESVAHAGENVLDKYRDKALDVTPEGVSLVLKCIDTIRDLVDELAETATEPEGNDAELIAQLNALAGGEGAPSPKVEGMLAQEASEAAPTTSEQGFPVAAELLAEYEEVSGGDSDDSPTTSDQGFPVAAELLAEYEEVTGGDEDDDEDAAMAEMAANAEMEKLAEEAEAAPEPEPEPAPAPAAAASVPAKTAEKKAPAKPAAGKPEGAGVQASLRVNVDVLENLMTMVS
ncbi:MAG: Hpt domain-containing protein, partial [Sphingomonadales bacterium]|nr:Hpt domain-containing protein [Sphingomonadales bacterium]